MNQIQNYKDMQKIKKYEIIVFSNKYILNFSYNYINKITTSI